MQELRITDWLPLSREEMNYRDWEEADVILINGDAYIDHPAFAGAMIARVIESQGLRVAIVSQPNWRDDFRDFRKLGKPKYFFAVTSGNMDSMVNHYTANKRLRSNDAYTPGGKSGFRPDHATTVYTRILKQIYPDVPVVIGGIEASMRRLSHYDYWSDQLVPSILAECPADLLVYGMGELAIIEIIKNFKAGLSIESMKNISQTAFKTGNIDNILSGNKWRNIEINSFESEINDKSRFATDFKTVEVESNKISASRITQKTGEDYIVVNPPYRPEAWKETDRFYELPFTRLPHPKYKKRGMIPAYEMIKFSVNIHRGCFGGCSFCTISAHQGKHIISRTEDSVCREIDQISKLQDFKGMITDLGGPSANMYKMNGRDMDKCRDCVRASCIYPKTCKNLDYNHKPLLNLYKRIEKHPLVKKVFIGSGIRYDLLVNHIEKERKENHLDEYEQHLITRNVSGRLKVAPEHTEDEVLKIMRKPSFSTFLSFKEKFDKLSARAGLKQQLIPYLISSHPGCTEVHMEKLAVKLKGLNIRPEQVQDFTPTPMTLASVMHYTALDPYSLKKIHVVKTIEEKKKQQRFFFWYK